VAFPTFFGFFSMIVQLCYLEVAGLATQHAAIIAARAAVVVAADDPRFYDGTPVGRLEGKRRAEVEEAVRNALRIAADNPKVHVTFTGSFEEGTIVKAKVTFDYDCWVPYGGTLVCGVPRRHRIEREAAMPAQTPGYEYP
jgi:hypothetical protein